MEKANTHGRGGASPSSCCSVPEELIDAGYFAPAVPCSNIAEYRELVLDGLYSLMQLDPRDVVRKYGNMAFYYYKLRWPVEKVIASIAAKEGINLLDPRYIALAEPRRSNVFIQLVVTPKTKDIATKFCRSSHVTGRWFNKTKSTLTLRTQRSWVNSWSESARSKLTFTGNRGNQPWYLMEV